MKRAVLFFFLILLFLILIILTNKNKQPNITSLKKINNMIKIASPVFNNGQSIPKKYTCKGQGINPPLTIDGVPTNSKSLVLIVDDPDAPSGTFTHWLVWNIDLNLKEIKENSVPTNGIQGTNDFGENKYGAPCPPFGTHRYYFRIYALDTKLNLQQTTKRSGLEEAIKNHMLENGELMGKYSR